MNKKFIKALLAPIGKGVVIFAVFGFALYAYAITFPPEQPADVTGVVGIYVGNGGSGTGSSGGYIAASSNKCNASFTDSHICSADEMINSYNNNIAALSGVTGQAWVNNGPPGYIAYIVNDCEGWSTNASTVFGSIWVFDDDKSSLTPCSRSLSFACCK